MKYEHIEPEGSDENDGEPDDAWRDEQVTIIATDDPQVAAWALIHLAYYPDARWVEKYLVSIIRGDGNESTQALAVTCLGHCARTHGTVDPDVVLPVLRWCLRQGQELRGRGYHAATDVTWVRRQTLGRPALVGPPGRTPDLPRPRPPPVLPGHAVRSALSSDLASIAGRIVHFAPFPVVSSSMLLEMKSSIYLSAVCQDHAP